MNPIAFLFDLDGVIIDSEQEYEAIWKTLSLNYGIHDPHFTRKIKGNHLQYITDIYFAHLSEQEKQSLRNDLREMESSMIYRPINGAIDFLNEVRSSGYKMGLVTSSSSSKMDNLYKQLPIQQWFQTVVTSDDISRGKPFPDAYLLAAERLNTRPEHCLVFEDSLAGIESGLEAGMLVYAVGNTFSKEELLKYTSRIIPDFKGFSLKCIL